MNSNKSFKDAAPMWAASSLIVVWFALLAAGVYVEGMNLFEFMGYFSEALSKPFSLHWTGHSLKFILIFLLIYVGGISVY